MDTLVYGSAKIIILGLTIKLSRVTIVLVEVNMAGLISTTPIDVYIRVITKSLVRYMKHLIKCDTDTPDDIRNVKNPVYFTSETAHGHVHTVAAARCPAQCPVIFLHSCNTANDLFYSAS